MGRHVATYHSSNAVYDMQQADTLELDPNQHLLKSWTRTMHPQAHPLAWSFSRIANASTAMQATISCDMTWPCEFHTSQRLGPNMSMTCGDRTAGQNGISVNLCRCHVKLYMRYEGSTSGIGAGQRTMM